MVKIGDIELSDFPLLLAPMEDVSDPLFAHFAKSKAQTWYTPNLSRVKALFEMLPKVS